MRLAIKDNLSIGLAMVMALVGVSIIGGGIWLALSNPEQQIIEIKNRHRRADVYNLASAIRAATDASSGRPLLGITGSTSTIKKTRGADLCTALVPNFMAALPVDPDTGYYHDCSNYDTGYTVIRMTTGSNWAFTVAAPSAELGEVIQKTK